jgi:hypothetical protein
LEIRIDYFPERSCFAGRQFPAASESFARPVEFSRFRWVMPRRLESGKPHRACGIKELARIGPNFASNGYGGGVSWYRRRS